MPSDTPIAVRLFERVRNFMQVGGQTVDQFNVQQTGLYIGLICEELAETISVVADAAVTQTERVRMHTVAALLQQFSMEFREGAHRGDILRCDHAELLDGFIDLAVVSVGAISSFSPDGSAATAAVLDANDAKYLGGVAQRTPDGKIKKPEGWRAADLTPFIPQVDRSKD